MPRGATAHGAAPRPSKRLLLQPLLLALAAAPSAAYTPCLRRRSALRLSLRAPPPLASALRHELLSSDEVDSLASLTHTLLEWRRLRASSSAALRREPTDGEMARLLGLPSAAEYASRLQNLHAANHKLVLSNLRLVLSIAGRYAAKGCVVSRSDLVQEGALGLIRAAEKYDPSLGFRFSSYATQWIRMKISRAIAQQSRTVRVPTKLHFMRQKMHRTANELFGKLGRRPTPDEIASEMCVDRAMVDQLCYMGTFDYMHSLDSRRPSAGDGDGLALAEMISAPAWQAERPQFLFDLQKVLGKVLTERECKVIGLRYGLFGGREHSVEEVRACLQPEGSASPASPVSTHRVRQIEAAALGKLRRLSEHDAQLRMLMGYLQESDFRA